MAAKGGFTTLQNCVYLFPLHVTNLECLEPEIFISPITSILSRPEIPTAGAAYQIHTGVPGNKNVTSAER